MVHAHLQLPAHLQLHMRPWALQALSAVAWVQAASRGEHVPQPVTDCNDVACVSASNAGETHRQARIGAILADGIGGESPQYICADDAKRTRCPTVAAQLGASPLNLTIPSHARWLFEGPSYTQEIYDTLVAANGGCRSSRGRRLSATEAAVLIPPRDERGQADNEVDSKGPTYDSNDACHLANGAVVAYLNGELVRGFVRNHAWTHGFFMQPHNKKYRIEHERAAAERDDVDEKAFADTQVCHTGLESRTSRLRACPQSTRHGAPGRAATHTLARRLGQGKDMCLPQEVIYAADTYQGNESTFAAYVECMRAHSEFTDKHGDSSPYTLAGFEGILPEEVCWDPDPTPTPNASAPGELLFLGR